MHNVGGVIIALSQEEDDYHFVLSRLNCDINLKT